MEKLDSKFYCVYLLLLHKTGWVKINLSEVKMFEKVRAEQ